MVEIKIIDNKTLEINGNRVSLEDYNKVYSDGEVVKKEKDTVGSSAERDQGCTQCNINCHQRDKNTPAKGPLTGRHPADHRTVGGVEDESQVGERNPLGRFRWIEVDNEERRYRESQPHYGDLAIIDRHQHISIFELPAGSGSGRNESPNGSHEPVGRMKVGFGP